MGGYGIGDQGITGKSVRLHGDAGEVNLQAAELEMDKFRSSIGLMGYKPENIFNMDETGLYQTVLI